MKKIFVYVLLLLTTTQSFCQLEINHGIYNGKVISNVKDTINPESDVMKEVGKNVLGSEGFENLKLSLNDSSYQDRKNKLSQFLNKKKKFGIILLGWNCKSVNLAKDNVQAALGYGETNSVLKFFVFNPTKKIIKSITFITQGIPDHETPQMALYESLRYRGMAIVNYTGFEPIKKLDAFGEIKPKSAETHNFAFIWHPYGVRNVKLVSIKVKYTDNSTIFIKNPNDVIMTKNLYQSIFNYKSTRTELGKKLSEVTPGSSFN